MSETVNQVTPAAAQAATNAQAASPAAQGPEKTFTQAELDRIVAERLQRERAKYPDYETLRDKAAKYDAAEEAGKSELQKASDRAAKLQAELDKLKKADSVRLIREKVATAHKIPVSLLTGETEEACTEQAKAILAFARPKDYPSVQDGGEVHQTGGGATRDQFADWFKSTIGKE